MAKLFDSALLVSPSDSNLFNAYRNVWELSISDTASEATILSAYSTIVDGSWTTNQHEIIDVADDVLNASYVYWEDLGVVESLVDPEPIADNAGSAVGMIVGSGLPILGQALAGFMFSTAASWCTEQVRKNYN